MKRLVIVATLALSLPARTAGLQSAQTSGPAPIIPLCPGLTIVTAISDNTGDYETIKKIESVTPSAVRLMFSTEGPPRKNPVRSKVEDFRAPRTIRTQDLASATRYARFFSTALPETIPGTTALGASKAVLTSLRTSGEAELAVPNEGLLATVERTSADDIQFETQKIRRAGSRQMTLPVLVNDARVDLPVVHARGEFFGEAAEFFFLDDPNNPLAIKYAVARGELGDLLGAIGKLFGGVGGDDGAREDTRDVLQVVKISYSCAAPSTAAEPASASGGSGIGSGGRAGVGRGAAGTAPAARTLEQALAETGRADVYSIYFSFNSDRIREESKPTFDEIARLLTKYPAWKLTVGGHTDSIASDAFNLDLSRRRAAAVKDALVKQRKIDPARLSTNGYGESRPKDTNDTLEGRARNRRVELIRSGT